MNSFGNNLKITIFGESHSEQIGVVVDGMPSGIKININDFTDDLTRRNPNIIGTTERKELDNLKIVSGVFNNYTTGGAITIIVENSNQQSADYKKNKYRPSHTDFVANKKYNGYNDYRGGGIFSGRMTIGLVIAGVLAKKVLEKIKILKKIDIKAQIISIGGVKGGVKCNNISKKVNNLIKNAKEQGDTLGGIIGCSIKGVPIGIGEPFFNGFESVLSHIIFSIPGIVGIEFGDGFSIADKRGSEVNDLYINSKGETLSNHYGGVNGGISNGNDIIFRVAVRPPASILLTQKTFDFERKKITEQVINGRYDTCFAIRMPVIIEAVSAIAIADLLL
jgi:chorismate synthase